MTRQFLILDSIEAKYLKSIEFDTQPYSPACLKACAVQLSSIFTLIFNIWTNQGLMLVLFVDFNTIIPNTLLNKLTQLSVPTSICQWIINFLTDRQHTVNPNSKNS